MNFTHVTVNGVRVGLDADRNAFVADADGTPDQLLVGSVYRRLNGDWVSLDGEGFTCNGPAMNGTMRDALASLLMCHALGFVEGQAVSLPATYSGTRVH